MVWVRVCERWNKAYCMGLRRRIDYLRSRCNVILRLIQPLICVEILPHCESAHCISTTNASVHTRCTCNETSSMENRIYSEHRCNTDVRCNSNNREKKTHKFERAMLHFLSSLFSVGDAKDKKRANCSEKEKKSNTMPFIGETNTVFFFFFFVFIGVLHCSRSRKKFAKWWCA